jgi:hypothetical protein
MFQPDTTLKEPAAQQPNKYAEYSTTGNIQWIMYTHIYLGVADHKSPD